MWAGVLPRSTASPVAFSSARNPSTAAQKAAWRRASDTSITRSLNRASATPERYLPPPPPIRRRVTAVSSVLVPSAGRPAAEVQAALEARGLVLHSWGNGPGDTYGWHDHP